MRLKVGSLPAAIFAALGISNRQDYKPELLESVQPVVLINPESDVLNVTNFADSWTERGLGFLYGTSLAVGAGHGHIQLMNGGTTKNLYVDTISFTNNSSAGDFFTIRRYDTPLATLVGQGPNKFAGGAAGDGALRTDNASGVLGTILQTLSTYQTVPVQFTFNPPLILPPATGVMLHMNTAAHASAGSFQWREVSIV